MIWAMGYWPLAISSCRPKRNHIDSPVHQPAIPRKRGRVGGNANNDTVTFTNGTSIPIGTLLAWNWAGGSYTTPQYKRTYAASPLSAEGHQYPTPL